MLRGLRVDSINLHTHTHTHTHMTHPPTYPRRLIIFRQFPLLDLIAIFVEKLLLHWTLLHQGSGLLHQWQAAYVFSWMQKNIHILNVNNSCGGALFLSFSLFKLTHTKGKVVCALGLFSASECRTVVPNVFTWNVKEVDIHLVGRYIEFVKQFCQLRHDLFVVF